MIEALAHRRTARRWRRYQAARLNVTAAALLSRALWRLYRGRSPWSAGRWR
jgi:hypothetical protein